MERTWLHQKCSRLFVWQRTGQKHLRSGRGYAFDASCPYCRVVNFVVNKQENSKLSVYSKTYLGDGVYVEYATRVGQFVLTTEDGRSITNTIYLEPEVVDGLMEYVAAVRAGYKRGER